MAWAWKQELDPTTKFVLVALADHADDIDFICWPSFKHLTKKTGYSRPTIWKSINRLVSLSAIKRVGTHKSGANLYAMNIDNQLTSLPTPQLTSLTGVVNVGTGVVNVGNKLGNDVNPNHKNHKESSVTIIASDDAKKKYKKPVDPIWDALLAVCGLEGSTPTASERGAWNKAVGALRAVRATTGEIEAKAAAFRRRWPHVSLTPTALARHWSECVAGKPTTPSVFECPQDYYLPDGNINQKYVGKTGFR